MNKVNRIHVLLVALILAAAAIAGLSAALRTTHLGAAAHTQQLSAAQIAQRNRQLDKIEASLRAQARTASGPALPARPATQPIIYVRPKPIVHVIHRSHEGEQETERGNGGGFDD